jgi:uncharacterized membrane protein
MRVEHALSANRVRYWMRWAMAVLYLCAGFIHLQSPDAFLPIMPNWAPAPREVILITGVCEIAGAFGLLTRSFRWWAAVALALYAICVFPANIKHALRTYSYRNCRRAGGTMVHVWLFSRSSYGGLSIVGKSLAGRWDAAAGSLVAISGKCPQTSWRRRQAPGIPLSHRPPKSLRANEDDKGGMAVLIPQCSTEAELG